MPHGWVRTPGSIPGPFASGRAPGRDAQPPGSAPALLGVFAWQQELSEPAAASKQTQAGQMAAKKTPHEAGVGETLGTGRARALTMIKLANPDFPARQRWAGTRWFILCKSPGSGSMNVSGWNSPRAARSRYAACAIKEETRAGLAHRHQPPQAHEQWLAAGQGALRLPSLFSGLADAPGTAIAEGTKAFSSGACRCHPAQDAALLPSLCIFTLRRETRLVFSHCMPALPFGGPARQRSGGSPPPAPRFCQVNSKIWLFHEGQAGAWSPPGCRVTGMCFLRLVEWTGAASTGVPAAGSGADAVPA